jgi:hypothetical protein
VRAVTREEFARVVQAIEYKPGWRFLVDLHWDRPSHWCVTVRVQAEVTNAYPPHEKATMQSGYSVSDAELHHMDEDRAMRRVYSILSHMEIHELREFFKYKGVRPFDPHNGGESVMAAARA